MLNHKIKVLAFLLLILVVQVAIGQTNKEQALAKGMEAIKLMDAGKIAESIKLLQEAQKLDPDRFDYPYELAYAHYLKKDYGGAIRILEKVENHKDVTERFYQLLGNSYDISGKSSKAFEKYDAGLKKFPNSGTLYLEKGNVHWNKKEYEKALPYYEQGIEADPAFPSNYFRAARIYCASTEEVWGLIYGEIFVNLERNSERTAQISKLLFDTYKSEIKFKDENSASVSFCQQMIMKSSDVSDPKKMKLPFCMVYEPTLLLSIIGTNEINLNSLDKIRTAFVENYYKMGHDKTHPNLLFDYQNKVMKAGHLEAYNHWVLLKGDEAAFGDWRTTNKQKWDSFVSWFTDNGLKVNENNKFYSGQY